ncbi:hypothetical protein, partial [Vibrio sp. Y184]|uniref:hypothetical protein n=1 Tax=Vibrio sp. Y184 TaxID=3074705 RepID=UPI0029674E43
MRGTRYTLVLTNYPRSSFTACVMSLGYFCPILLLSLLFESLPELCLFMSQPTCCCSHLKASADGRSYI